MYYKKTVFLVAGLQKSGVSATKFLLKKGAKVFIYDMRSTEEIAFNIDMLISLGAIFVSDYNSIINEVDVLLISPGVPIDSDICVTYKNAGKRITGELELGFNEVNIPIIAVTGTNGKTTVSSLLHNVLLSSGVDSLLAGNIGVPITEVASKSSDYEVMVLEVSSYQLETTYSFIPHVSIILNITPDHLDRHYTMENYTLVKSKLILPQKESEFCILNYDDLVVRKLSPLTKAKVIWFSTKQRVNGAYLEDNKIYFNSEEIISISDLFLKERHNIENTLATICALKALKIDNLCINKGLKEFKGVKHRLQKVRTIGGVTFINDSKSTNPDSTIKAIESLQENGVIIVGGSDKGLDYTEMFECIKSSNKIKNTVITGSNAGIMVSYAGKVGLDGISVCKDFSDAVKLAYKLCQEGVVLLSPGTASFDEFKNFEERGDKFVSIVESLS